MSEPAPIYREDEGDGVPMTPLRSLHVVMSTLADAVRQDLAAGSGTCDSVLCQDPPAELAGAVAAVAMWGEALGPQLRLAAETLGATVRRARDPLPETAIVVQRLRGAIGHLAGVLDRWCANAEAQAHKLDEAARLVATGRARVVTHDAVTTVLPVVATTAGEAGR